MPMPRASLSSYRNISLDPSWACKPRKAGVTRALTPGFERIRHAFLIFEGDRAVRSPPSLDGKVGYARGRELPSALECLARTALNTRCRPEDGRAIVGLPVPACRPWDHWKSYVSSRGVHFRAMARALARRTEFGEINREPGSARTHPHRERPVVVDRERWSLRRHPGDHWRSA